MSSTAELPTKLELRSVQNPIHPPLMAKPSSPKPTLLEKQLSEAEANFKYCLEKGDVQRSLLWARKRRHLHKLFAESRNGEQHVQCAQCVQRVQYDDAEKHPQEPQECPGRRCEEDSCGRHEGAGVARLGEAHVRWPDEVRPDEDQEGPHRQQEEACARPQVSEEPEKGGLRSQEGDL